MLSRGGRTYRRLPSAPAGQGLARKGGKPRPSPHSTFAWALVGIQLASSVHDSSRVTVCEGWLPAHSSVHSSLHIGGSFSWGIRTHNGLHRAKRDVAMRTPAPLRACGCAMRCSRAPDRRSQAEGGEAGGRCRGPPALDSWRAAAQPGRCQGAEREPGMSGGSPARKASNAAVTQRKSMHTAPNCTHCRVRAGDGDGDENSRGAAGRSMGFVP